MFIFIWFKLLLSLPHLSYQGKIYLNLNIQKYVNHLDYICRKLTIDIVYDI